MSIVRDTVEINDRSENVDDVIDLIAQCVDLVRQCLQKGNKEVSRLLWLLLELVLDGCLNLACHSARVTILRICAFVVCVKSRSIVSETLVAYFHKPWIMSEILDSGTELPLPFEWIMRHLYFKVFLMFVVFALIDEQPDVFLKAQLSIFDTLCQRFYQFETKYDSEALPLRQLQQEFNEKLAGL